MYIFLISFSAKSLNPSCNDFSINFLPKYEDSIDQHIAWQLCCPFDLLLASACLYYVSNRDPKDLPKRSFEKWNQIISPFDQNLPMISLFHLELNPDSLSWHTSPWLTLLPSFSLVTLVTTRVLQTLFGSIRHASTLESWTLVL